jgi:SAM-dependent methyltransferase
MMNQPWDEQYKNMWDNRYKDEQYAYGKEPNLFFKEWLQKFKPGTILMPADGEGRNGVFAAQSGWEVTSFDLSVEGRAKALQLAKENNVTLEYQVGDLNELNFEAEYFDAIGLIYAHFAANKKAAIHKKLSTYLKPGGVIIFEAFSKKQHEVKKNYLNAGGPADIDMLFSEAELLADFEGYKILMLQEEAAITDEGIYHNGKSEVLRFVAQKP